MDFGDVEKAKLINTLMPNGTHVEVWPVDERRSVKIAGYKKKISIEFDWKIMGTLDLDGFLTFVNRIV